MQSILMQSYWSVNFNVLEDYTFTVKQAALLIDGVWVKQFYVFVGMRWDEVILKSLINKFGLITIAGMGQTTK